jgi:hypothetical protein
MALDPAFVDDSPYGPDALMFDQIVSIEPERGYVCALMPTHAELPLTREQRVHPKKHPQHVAGGLMVHVTGMLGLVHAYYILGLRHRDGWIGYGAKINSARFHNIAKIGAPLKLECTGTVLRRGSARIFCRYTFRFTQEDKLVYEGDQAAMWMFVDENATEAADSL